MLTDRDAQELSKLLTEADVFPEAKEGITRTLFDYYKQLLYRELPPIPTPRRMW